MNALLSAIGQNFRRSLPYLKPPTLQFHSLRRALPNGNTLYNQINNSQTINLLQPNVPSLWQACGFKVKGVLKKRCKDCYFVVRDSRRYVLCPTHGRHKLMSKLKYFKNRITLTHATQGKFRPW